MNLSHDGSTRTDPDGHHAFRNCFLRLRPSLALYS